MGKGKRHSAKKYEQEKIAFVAGIFVGEGTISIHKTKTHKYLPCLTPMFGIGNTEREVLEYCQTITGGYIPKPFQRKAHRKKCWTLILKRRVQLKKTCLLLRPYLLGKKAQIVDLVLEFIDIHRVHHGYSKREYEIYEIIKQLNKRGKENDQRQETQIQKV